jgi:hypothetical protein
MQEILYFVNLSAEAISSPKQLLQMLWKMRILL